MIPTSTPFSVGHLASLACLHEVMAPKPGNVHRGADFEDMVFSDFVTSAIAIAPAMDAACGQSLGATILQAVTATQEIAGKNTNLGMILLMAPVAKVANGANLREGVTNVLGALTQSDSHQVYAAIRMAVPGGMGAASKHDLSDPAPDDLIAAMRLAADRDRVAYQYVHNFETVFDDVLPDLVKPYRSMSERIVDAHVRQMARTPDTLILRKCGQAVAQESSDRADRVLSCGAPESEDYQTTLADLDFWLRSDGHRRNPGTTADLIAAGLFVGLRNRSLGTGYS